MKNNVFRTISTLALTLGLTCLAPAVESRTLADGGKPILTVSGKISSKAPGSEVQFDRAGLESHGAVKIKPSIAAPPGKSPI